MIEVNVKFKKKLYGTSDGNFSIFSAESATFADSKKVKENNYGNFTISGDYFLTDEELGQVFTVTIEEDLTAKYPNSYKLIKLHYDFPKDAEAQWTYLENSNIIPLRTIIELGKVFKRTENILDIIVETPEKLEKVKGIGKERASKYQIKLLENKEKAVLFAEYGDIDGVGSKLISKLYSWKPRVEDVIKTLKSDPFSMVSDLEVGFMLADKFRDLYKFPLDDRNRILHGVSYYLNQSFQSTGNTYEEILTVSRDIAVKLQVPYKNVIMLLAEIQNDETELYKYKLKIFGQNITTSALFKAELIVYKRIKEMMVEKKTIADPAKWADRKNTYLANLPQQLSDEQGHFLDLINEERVCVLLGPGGAGKSWVINIACNLVKESGKTFGLYAPTARAAKVMSDYVGTEAQTVHRGLMKYVMAGEIAPYDLLIVDEFSMVDSELASTIVQAMGPNTRLIIVGDDYQLQSVAPGNVLFDLVEYVGVPTVRLTKVFRQQEEGGILDYAQALRKGTFKLPSGAPRIEDNNIVFIHETNDERKQEIAMKLYQDALSKVKNDYEDVMLLSPMNKSSAGRRILNKRVQEIVNPGNGKNECVFGAGLKEDDQRYFRKGDYISVTSNQYDMINDVDELTQIINGDLGEITQATKNTVTFKINKNSYTIEKSDITNLLDHAWSITIHKSQGGQASEVIIVLPETSYFMLNSNMIYTAITRARLKCYLIGNFDEINKAAKRRANFSRKTMIQLQKSVEDKAQ